MASMNKVFLIGNLGKDPDLSFFGNSRARLSFTLATNESYKTQEGTWKQTTEWHRIVAWGPLAQQKADVLRKGKKILVEGRIKTRQYTTQDGSPRTITEVAADRLLLLERRTPEGPASAVEIASEPVLEQAPESDVPF